MSFPVEAGPESPGHVGHTPQHVGLALVRARAAGILSSGAFTHYAPIDTAMQPVPQPQGFGHLSQVATLIRVEDFRRRMDPRAPWPAQFEAGVRIAENPPPEPPAGPRVPGAPVRPVSFEGGRY